MLRPHQQERQRAARRARRASSGRIPLTHPAFNLREIAKQLLLLEDHLQNHYCDDCIRKHLMTVEAFAEEAKCLDSGRIYGTLFDELAEMARTILEAVADANDSDTIRDLAQDIRKCRKDLVPLVYDPRGVEGQKRVAAVALARGKHKIAVNVSRMRQYMQRFTSANEFAASNLKGVGGKSPSYIVGVIDTNSRTRLNLGALRSQARAMSDWWFLHVININNLNPQTHGEVVPSGKEDLSKPLVVGTRGTILDGRHRVALAQQKGLTSMPAYIPASMLYEILSPRSQPQH